VNRGTHAIWSSDVVKRYPNGAIALKGATFEVRPGELVAIVGPSGSGKTTLFRLCNGAVRPTSGNLEVLGVSMASARGSQLRDLRRRVAFVYQNHNLVSSISVMQNVLIGRLGRVGVLAAIKGAILPSDEERGSVYALLDELHISDKLYDRSEDLSGGQQQRVAIARALMQEPRILLADEPIASVDTETATVILDLLVKTVRERQATVLVSLHQRQYVEQYCDRVIELRSGVIVRDEQVTKRDAIEREPVSATL
jgi:phosphonate transport system ATP-binding protein